MPLQAVLFDMDGVLCHSEAFIAEAAIAMFAEVFGVSVSEEDFRPYVGCGEDRYLGGVAADKGLPLELPKHKDAVYEVYLERIKGRLQALPGVHDFVARLEAAGIKRAVASAADRIKVDGNLREIGLPEARFDAVITGDETARKKPDPQCYQLAAGALGLEPTGCLVIEDAVNGCQAGKAAGCRVLGICSTFPADELRAAGADWTTADLALVPAGCLEALGLS